MAQEGGFKSHWISQDKQCTWPGTIMKKLGVVSNIIVRYCSPKD
jgi:hypothetical protein